MTEERENHFLPYKNKKKIWAICRYCGQPHSLLYEKFKRLNSACHKECSEIEKSIESPFKNADTLKKAKETFIKKYGVDNPQKKIEIKEKTKQTNLKRYGVGNVFENSEIKEKIKKTNIEKYGVDNISKSIDHKKKQNNSYFISITDNDNYKTHNLLQKKEFWDDLGNKDLRFISKENNVNYSSLISALNEEKYKEKYQKIYTYPQEQKQKEIIDFIYSLGFNLISNDRTAIKPFELDIYIPEKNFAIEFNGSYWHSENVLTIEKAKKYHYIKTKLCENLGIRLIHIFENTWDTRKEQIKSFIRSALDIYDYKIYARECLVNNDINRDFIDNNHIQKCPNNIKKYFNLIYDNKCIASMTASLHHRKNDKKQIVLSRLCYKSGFKVIGGTKRLFAYFVKWAKDNNYQEIISWSDNIYTYGNIYKHLNFDLLLELKPDYFYWDKSSGFYISKQSRKKGNTDCPIGVTERDFAFSEGLYRIWDSGKRTWIYRI